MNETLTSLHDPALRQLITDIRRILIQHETPNHVKLSAIAKAVDELAPPPAP